MARSPAADKSEEPLDFNLQIRPTGPGSSTFTAYVASSPAGNAEQEFQLPIRAVELENFLLKIGQPRRPVRRGANRVSPDELAKDFGGLLFKSVFADKIGACFRSSQNIARSRGRQLRIRLRVRNAPLLSDLPWEFLYDRQNNHFLALSPFVRELDLSRSSVEPPLISPLRILVVNSKPAGVETLDGDRELRMLENALTDLRDNGLVELEQLEVATLDELRSQLRRSEWHVLHFIGHGGFEDGNGGLLVFQNARGEAVEVSAEKLGFTLAGHPTLRLVLLNACEGARTEVTDPFAGTAQQLMQQGIPAVVAMQFEITDDAAIVMSHEFYRALADGVDLDEALTNARLAVLDVSDVEWATPVLYMSGEGGRLFKVAPGADRSSAALKPVEVVEASRARLAATDTTPPTIPPVSQSRARRILAGAQAVTAPVRRTLGPLARPVVLQTSEGSVRYTTDAQEAARSVSVDSLEERIGADLIHTLIDDVRTAASDGAATAAIVGEEVIAGLTELVEQGAHPQALSRELEAQTTAVLEQLGGVTSAVEFKEQIESLVSTYADDTDIGEIISEAVDKVGKEGVIVVEESNTFGLELYLCEGMRFDRGYISPHFVTDEQRGIAVLNEPYILLVSVKIIAIKDLLPLLEKVIETGFPLVLIAEDVDGEALSTLVVNKSRGTFVSAAVKAPGYGDRRKAILGDLAILTGATVLPEAGPTLEAAELDVLGRARSVVITRDSTTIVDAAGDPDLIAGRVQQLRHEIEQIDSDWDRGKLEERLAKLAGGVAIVKVGGPKHDQTLSRVERIEGAIRLTAGAIDRGIVVGGGKALAVTASFLSAGTPKPPDFMLTALTAPLRQLAINAGIFDAGAVVQRVGDSASDEAFDARTGEFSDLASWTVFDSADVMVTVVSSAAACARKFLSIL